MQLLVNLANQENIYVPIGQRGLSIGRDSSNDLILDDPRVSRHHAKITFKNDRYLYEDLNSANGSIINGEMSVKRYLEVGDKLLMGKISLMFINDKPVVDDAELKEMKDIQFVTENPGEMIEKRIDTKKSTIMEYDEALEKAGLFKKTAKNLSILYKTGNVLNSILEEDKLLQEMVNLIEEVILADRYIVLLRDEGNQHFVPTIIRKKDQKRSFVPVIISQKIVQEVAEKGQSVIISTHVQHDHFQATESMIVHGIRSAMCAPIATGEHLLGLVYLDSLSRLDQFKEDDLRLLSALSQQGGVALDNVRLMKQIRSQERIQQELQIARKIQQTQLPHKFPDLDHFDICFKNFTAEEVGGDYYDFIRSEDGRWSLVIADVSGKGVPGALVISLFRALLKSNIQMLHSPSDLLKKVNQQLFEDTERDIFVTALLGILDESKSQFLFSRAGHLPLLVYRKNNHAIEKYEPKGVVLGMVTDIPLLEEKEIFLSKGDVLIFYTDGIIEAENSHAQVYGQDQFIRTLEEILGDANLSSKVMIDQIILKLDGFRRDHPYVDDLTIGLVKVR